MATIELTKSRQDGEKKVIVKSIEANEPPYGENRAPRKHPRLAWALARVRPNRSPAQKFLEIEEREEATFPRSPRNIAVASRPMRGYYPAMTRERRESNKIIQERKSAMMSRSRKVIPCTTLVIAQFVCCIGFCAAPQEDKGVVNIILEAIRRPRPGEFSKPEDVVSHFLQCVRDREFDEALKCFPIHEHYENYSFDVWVKNLGMFSFVDTPLPESSFHSLSLAMRYAATYDRVSAALLGLDVARIIAIGEGNDTDTKSLEEIKQKLDISKLKNLSVKEIRVDLEVPKERISDLHKALGVKELCIVKAEVKMPGEENTMAGFIVGKINDNWRILGLG